VVGIVGKFLQGRLSYGHFWTSRRRRVDGTIAPERGIRAAKGHVRIKAVARHGWKVLLCFPLGLLWRGFWFMQTADCFYLCDVLFALSLPSHTQRDFSPPYLRSPVVVRSNKMSWLTYWRCSFVRSKTPSTVLAICMRHHGIFCWAI